MAFAKVSAAALAFILSVAGRLPEKTSYQNTRCLFQEGESPAKQWGLNRNTIKLRQKEIKYTRKKSSRPLGLSGHLQLHLSQLSMPVGKLWRSSGFRARLIFTVRPAILLSEQDLSEAGPGAGMQYRTMANATAQTNAECLTYPGDWCHSHMVGPA